MSGPEPAALSIGPGSGFRPRGLALNWGNAAYLVLGGLAILGVVMYVLRLSDWGDRPEWAYPTALMMWMLATFATAPLLAFATRMTRGYWSYPVRRIATLFIVPFNSWLCPAYPGAGQSATTRRPGQLMVSFPIWGAGNYRCPGGCGNGPGGPGHALGDQHSGSGRQSRMFGVDLGLARHPQNNGGRLRCLPSCSASST